MKSHIEECEFCQAESQQQNNVIRYTCEFCQGIQDTKTIKLTKEDVGYILHLLQTDYQYGGSKGYTPEKMKRVGMIQKKISEMWLDFDEEEEEEEEEEDSFKGIDDFRRIVKHLDFRNEELNENKTIHQLFEDAIKIDKSDNEDWIEEEVTE